MEQIVGFPDSIFVTKWVHTGFGKHIECLSTARAYSTRQWGIAVKAPRIISLGLVKVSLCLYVLRVIDRVERRIAIFLRVNIVLLGTVHVAQLAMLLAQCRPLNALWDLSVHGRCYSPPTTNITTYIAFGKVVFAGLAELLTTFRRPRWFYGSGLLGDPNLPYMSNADECKD